MEVFEIHLHTESRVLQGRLATSGPRASQPTYSKERVCVNEGCTTTLSICFLRGGARPPTDEMIHYIDRNKPVRGRADLRSPTDRPVHLLRRSVPAALGPQAP